MVKLFFILLPCKCFMTTLTMNTLDAQEMKIGVKNDFHLCDRL